MNLFKISAIAICLAFSTGAMAQSMSKDQYKSGKDGIAAEYKEKCDDQTGDVKDVCVRQAKAAAVAAKAQARARMTNANANAKENAPATSDEASQNAEKGAGARKD